MENTGKFLELLAAQTKDLIFVYDYGKQHFDFLSPTAPIVLGVSQEDFACWTSLAKPSSSIKIQRPSMPILIVYG